MWARVTELSKNFKKLKEEKKLDKKKNLYFS